MADSPVYCVTSDFDWASDYCLSDFVDFMAGAGVKPTIFGTHRSEALDRYLADGVVEVGVHPNFLPGSSHGADDQSVIDHVFELFPHAESYRSHCFADSTHIARRMLARGIRYDSNLCLYLQPDIVPLAHGTGLTRYPVFWEDDCHWDLTGGDWDLDRYLDRFLTPGLKIINVHPFPFAGNIRDTDHYLGAKSQITTLSKETAAELGAGGDGTRTFVTSLIETLVDRGATFRTLSEIHAMTSSDTGVR